MTSLRRSHFENVPFTSQFSFFKLYDRYSISKNILLPLVRNCCGTISDIFSTHNVICRPLSIHDVIAL